MFYENLKRRFAKKYKFSNHDINKFGLLLLNGVYSYKYMDDWEKLNETSLSEKEDFYSHLNLEDITDADYTRTKRVCKDSETKSLGEYHDLYVQSDTLLLADVFNTSWNTYSEIYGLDPAHFFCTRISMTSSLKKILK